MITFFKEFIIIIKKIITIIKYFKNFIIDIIIFIFDIKIK